MQLRHGDAIQADRPAGDMQFDPARDGAGEASVPSTSAAKDMGDKVRLMTDPGKQIVMGRM